MDEVKALKSTRASIKGQMTKLYNYVLAPSDRKDVDGFQSKLARTRVLLKQFEDVENAIFGVDSEQDSGMIDFTEQFYVVEAKLNRYIREYNLQNPDESQNPVNNSMNLTMSHALDVRLPKITIEPFSRQYTEWQSFYDLYVKTIHENTNLSPAQKFQYLKGFLQWDAYNLLKHMSITETNYFEAFRKLCARYDRKKHTIKAFIRSFIEQPTIHQPTAINMRKLLDTSDEVIRGLKAMGREAESRDVWLTYLLEEKLDADTRTLWAQSSCEEDLPTLESFFKFLLNRSEALESVKPQATKRGTNQKAPKIYISTDTNSCPLCKTDHSLEDCEKFKRFSILERRQCIKADNRCFNCLKLNHPVFRCLSRGRCGECGKKHHSLLYQKEIKGEAIVASPPKPRIANAHARVSMSNVLPTAVVKVVDHIGSEHECRILLDSGSMSTFITERFTKKLNLPRRKHRVVVTGISGSGSQATKGVVKLTLKSRLNTSTQIQVEALVMTKLCSKLPTQSFDAKILNTNISLADPHYNKSKDIDIILGVQHVFNVLLGGRIKQNRNIIAVETIFGWVIGGGVESHERILSNISQIETEQPQIDDMLKRFWELEELPNVQSLTEDEETCVKTKERKFQKNLDFKNAYIKFMQEYQQLGHMVEINGSEIESYNYLPHHGISKSDTSKFRVVFDASAKTSNGCSLNDLLMVGPQVQPTLYAIVLRFRLHKIAISADVEKMYRQILVNENHVKYQAIVWRPCDRLPMQYFKLNTLTYGTAAAPYLATRVLNELASLNQNKFSEASNALRTCTYVDDLMAGANTVNEAIELRSKLINILAQAGMKLKKWVSNSDEFLSTTPEEDRAECVKDFTQHGKALGPAVGSEIGYIFLSC